MATSVASVVSHFPEAENGFTTTTAGSVGSGAATVTLNSVAGYTNGKPVVLVIDPTDPAKKQTFTGIVDTSGVQITSVVWTAGTNQTHALGATVVDYATATHISMISKGIEVEHNQDGTHDEAIIQSRSADTAPASGDLILTSDVSASNALKKVTLADLFKTPPVTSGTMSATDWKEGVLPAASGTITNNGNRSYDITFASTVASLLSPGMRLRTTRTVTAPTYMGGAFNGTSHYFIKTTPTSTLSTVTNNFTLMAWVEPTSYTTCAIAARTDAAVNNSLEFGLNASGQVRVTVVSGGAANVRYIDSHQSLPLNKKTHVAVSWTSGTVVIYFDGVSVPVTAAATGGTAPTTAGTGGDFAVGRRGASSTYYFPGYISGLGVFDAVLTASTIRSYSSQVLSGSETNCIGAWSLNNTGVNQQAAGTNDLTATGGVSYTVRSPYGTDANGVTAGTTDYALVMKVSTTTATVQVPEGCTIPTSGGVSAVAYSTATSPFGFTLDKGRWIVEALYKVSTGLVAIGSINNWFVMSIRRLTVPVGSYTLGYSGAFQLNSSVSGVRDGNFTLASSTPTSAVKYQNLTTSMYRNSVTDALDSLSKYDGVTISSPTDYYMYGQISSASGTENILMRDDLAGGILSAMPAGI